MNPAQTYWNQFHFRRELLRNAADCMRPPFQVQTIRHGMSLVKRCINRHVFPGNVEKYEAVWKALRDRSTRTILDIGSLDGADAIELSRIFPQANLHCFEPDPLNYAILKRNTSRHKRIRTYQLALSDSRGTASFHASGDETDAYHKRASGSLLAPLSTATDWWPDLRFDRVFEVETTTVHDWALENEVTSIDLIWMDVQGAEYGVLSGMKNLLKHTQCIVLEIWMQPAYAGAATLSQIQSFLEGEGFYMTRLWRSTNRIDGDAMFQRV